MRVDGAVAILPRTIERQILDEPLLPALEKPLV
jgi:hypothetical protein